MTESGCCSGNLYRIGARENFLGETWHPGGMVLSSRVGQQIGAHDSDLILDVGCGVGTTSRLLSEQFGCRVVGMDVSSANAGDALRRSKGNDRVSFLAGDGHGIPASDKSFDGAVLECVLSTFQDKRAAARELARVLKERGRLGMSDVIVEGEIPEELRSPLVDAFCVGGALSSSEYRGLLEQTGFRFVGVEKRKQDTLDFLEQIRRQLFVARMLVGVHKLVLDSQDLDYVGRLLSLAKEAVKEDRLGYAVLIAVKDGQ